MIFKSKKKKLIEETYDLTYTFYEWVNKYFKEYLKYADKVVDLEWKTYKYNGKKYTLKQIIYEMINITDNLLIDDYSYVDEYSMQEELLDLFRLVFYDMWW